MKNSKASKLLGLVYCKTCNNYVILVPESNIYYTCKYENIDSTYHRLLCNICNSYTTKTFRLISNNNLVCASCAGPSFYL